MQCILAFTANSENTAIVLFICLLVCKLVEERLGWNFQGKFVLGILKWLQIPSKVPNLQSTIRKDITLLQSHQIQHNSMGMFLLVRPTSYVVFVFIWATHSVFLWILYILILCFIFNSAPLIQLFDSRPNKAVLNVHLYILKIGQYLVKIWTKVCGLLFGATLYL